MDLFDTLETMLNRREGQASNMQVQEAQERADKLSILLTVFRQPGYKFIKQELYDELAELDRVDVDEPGTAIRLQGERRAIRRILDRLEANEAAVNRELRDDRAEFDEQVS